MTKLIIFAPIIDPWFIFVGKACAEMGISCRLITLNEEVSQYDGDGQDCLKWLSLNPSFIVEKFNLNELNSLSGETCFVLIRGNFGARERTLVGNLCKNFSRRVAFLHFAPSSIVWQAKQVSKEILRPYFSLFTEIWTLDANINLLCRILAKNHRYFGVFPHQRCCILHENWSRLAEDIPIGDRRYLFAWSGSANPIRDPLAEKIRKCLNASRESTWFEGITGTHEVIWNYDQPGSIRPRPYDSYISELESAWFTLCLPGFTGITHRMLEAVLRGSIPIMPEELVKFHCLPLIDRINVILVKNGDWIEALEYIERMKYSDRMSMQNQVCKLALSDASLASISAITVQNILGNHFAMT